MFIFRKTTPVAEPMLIDSDGSATTSTVHQIEEFAWGSILLGTLAGGATVFQFFVSDEEDGTYVEVYRSGADMDVAVVSDRAIKIPDEAMTASWLKVGCNGGNQTAGIAKLILKT